MSDEGIRAEAVEPPDFARSTINLADARLGAAAVAASDEFFAPLARMLNPEPPVFHPDLYDEHGKWMDGWETRRRRDTGHDWGIVRLAIPGVVAGLDLDTSFFTGNYAPAASVEACYNPQGDPDDGTAWHTLLAPVSLQGDTHRFVAIDDDRAWTHLRVHIHPDGGIARLRVYGRARIDWDTRDPAELHDLAAASNGGRAVACNDAHYGSPQNLLRPGRGVNMGDGWETRRRREPGNDWCLLELGHPGTIRRVEIDTAHFKGNFPHRCSIQAAYVEAGTDRSLISQSLFWQVLLPEQPLSADSIQVFEAELHDLGPVSHVRFNIIPDGGVSRVRLLGRIDGCAHDRNT